MQFRWQGMRSTYADISLQPPDMHLTPSDPRWVGAWWLGYFCGGLLLLVTSLLILAYPREMPGTKEIRAQAIREGKFFVDRLHTVRVRNTRTAMDFFILKL